VILYRIATETRQHPADDLSGRGAALGPGRWNDAGQAVVYAATTRAMAVLETAAHLPACGLPLNRYLVEIEMDAQVWRKRTRWSQDELPIGWDAVPAGLSSVARGAAWFAAGKTALLEGPSVIVPEEGVVVIHPMHPDARAMRARKVRGLEYDRLFR
jgi:RES domain-containing protein